MKLRHIKCPLLDGSQEKCLKKNKTAIKELLDTVNTSVDELPVKAKSSKTIFRLMVLPEV